MRKATEPPEPDLFTDSSGMVPENYSLLERHADFRAVLLGSEQGRRVYYQILALGNLWKSSLCEGKPDLTAFLEGKRWLALEIRRIVNKPPADQLAKAIRTRPKE